MNKAYIGNMLVDPRQPIGSFIGKDGSIKYVYPVAGGAVYNPSGSGNVHIDQILTQISVGFPNTGLVGNVLYPSVTVRKQSDKYYVFGREAWLPEDDIRAPGDEANEIPGLQLSTDTYYAQEHALQIPVTDEERENADAPLSPDRDGTELVTGKIMIGRELAQKNLATTAANYAAGMTVTNAGTQQWNDYVNSTPISDVKTGRRAINAQIFMDPNLGIIPYQVMSTLEDHPDFIERIKYSERGVITAEIIAALFGIERIVVPGAGINTANPGQAASLGYIWGKDVLLAYVPPRAGMRIPAFGYEFVWGFGGNTPQVVDRWREERRASDLIRVRRRYDLKQVAVDVNGKSIAGYLIKSAIA
jgi:hypothetical protein